MFPGQGLQQPLHFGLEFHNRLAVAWVFLWSRQKVEKEKGIVIVCLARRWGGHLPRAWTRESWGSAWPRTSEEEAERHLEFLRQSSWVFLTPRPCRELQ